MPETPALQASSPSPTPRLIALDAFRGLTMLAMVVVNNPGSWDHVYAPLKHASWNGITPTDLIFPFFLFLVGASFSISTRPALDSGKPLRWTKLLLRALALIALGIFLNGFPYYPDFDPAHWRFTGVLQRIGLCFLLAAALVDVLRLLRLPLTPSLVLVSVFTLTGYGWFVGSPERSTDVTFFRYADVRLLTKGHIYQGSMIDPEGLYSTIPAVVSVLLGVVAARLALPVAPGRVLHLLAWSLFLTTIGGLLHTFNLSALNKTIWSPAYTVLTAGLAGVLFAFFLRIEPAASPAPPKPPLLLRPFVIAGRNAILLFVGSGLLARLLNQWVWADAQGLLLPFRDHAFRFISSSGCEPALASLAYALGTLVLWWLVLWALDRRSIYIKI